MRKEKRSEYNEDNYLLKKINLLVLQIKDTKVWIFFSMKIEFTSCCFTVKKVTNSHYYKHK